MQDTPPLTNPPPLPSLPTPLSTPSPLQNHFVPPTGLFPLASTSPACQPQTPFAFPTLSPAEWYRLNTFTLFFPNTQYPDSAPMGSPETVVQPTKQRGQPPKVRPIPVHTPEGLSTLSSASQAKTLNNTEGLSQTADLVGQCWFVKQDDGRSNMAMVALWCSEFKNFTTWRTKPKQIGGEQVSTFLLSHGHPKREGRE